MFLVISDRGLVKMNIARDISYSRAMHSGFDWVYCTGCADIKPIRNYCFRPDIVRFQNCTKCRRRIRLIQENTINEYKRANQDPMCAEAKHKVCAQCRDIHSENGDARPSPDCEYCSARQYARDMLRKYRQMRSKHTELKHVKPIFSNKHKLRNSLAWLLLDNDATKLAVIDSPSEADVLNGNLRAMDTNATMPVLENLFVDVYRASNSVDGMLL